MFQNLCDWKYHIHHFLIPLENITTIVNHDFANEFASVFYWAGEFEGIVESLEVQLVFTSPCICDENTGSSSKDLNMGGRTCWLRAQSYFNNVVDDTERLSC